jgi:hypothetical protein
LYLYDTILERLAQGLEDLAPAFGSFIQEEPSMGRQRHLPQRRHLATAEQAHIRDRLVQGATWAGRDQGGAGTGEAGDAMDTDRREDGREAARHLPITPLPC